MIRMSNFKGRQFVKGLAMVAALALVAGDVHARAGGGKSGGSRGSMSRSAPPTTDTAPRTAAPLPGSQMPSAGVAGAGAAAAAKAPSRFGGGLMGGLAMGFLGAGLFGLLSGHGFMSGLGSMMGFLGLLLQIGLVFFVVRFALNWFRNRNQPAAAGNAPGFARSPVEPGVLAGTMGGGAASVAPAQPAPQPLKLSEADFGAFERLLGEVQDCYSRADRNGMMLRATPEMVQFFGHEVDDLARRGLSNKVSNIKLLQGDLAEAWREPSAEYATVAMRFALSDVTVETATGRVVEGDANAIQEATEVWTFVRRPGESPEAWRLSAIQQA